MNWTADWSLPALCGLGLHFRLDGFRAVYLCIAVLMWGVSGIFSRGYMAREANKKRFYVFFWATFFATAGVFLSADLYTTFIFFEVMSFTSYVWVAQEETAESLRAAQTYLAVAVIGGLVMLMGLFLLYRLCGTLEFDALAGAAGQIPDGPEKTCLYAAGGCLLFGFGAKAGCFPLHVWLPKAHPAAPAPASALLSGILTKAGIFGIILVSCRMFAEDAGWGLLVAALGAVTMFWGAFLALFSVNLKRTLACSSVSQIGFMLVGIGMSCLLRFAGADPGRAVAGVFLHMINHSLFKLVLFLCAGTVWMNLGRLELDDIRGFGRKKPLLRFCFLMGALGLGGVPLWSGYISKTLLHESIVEYAAMAGAWGGARLWRAAEGLFLFSGGMTVAYMLKLYVALFVDRHPVRQAEFDAMSGRYLRPAAAAALAFPAALIPALGVSPHRTMERLALLGEGFFGREGAFSPAAYFSWESLSGALISAAIGVLLYLTFIRGALMRSKAADGARYIDRWPGWLDLENLIYRPLLQTVLPGVCGAVYAFIDRYLLSAAKAAFMAVSAVVCRAMDSLADGAVLLGMNTVYRRRVPEEERSAGRAREEKAAKVRSGWRRLAYNGKLAEESFSFGLMLFGIGLCLTLGYLLFVFFGGGN